MKYKGQLKGFPQHVVELMLKRQVEQGNERNVEVFEEYAAADKSDGGFDWDYTSEGVAFWFDVIEFGKFDITQQPEPELIRSRAISCDASMEELRAEKFISKYTYRGIMGKLRARLKDLGVDTTNMSDIDLYEASIKEDLHGDRTK